LFLKKIQKLALSSGANAMGLGMGLSVGGMFPGSGGGMMTSMISSGAPIISTSGGATKIICLSHVRPLYLEAILPKFIYVL